MIYSSLFTLQMKGLSQGTQPVYPGTQAPTVWAQWAGGGVLAGATQLVEEDQAPGWESVGRASRNCL